MLACQRVDLEEVQEQVDGAEEDGGELPTSGQAHCDGAHTVRAARHLQI
jgi:hypothetical protein